MDFSIYSRVVIHLAFRSFFMAFQQTEEYGDIDAIPDLPVLPEETNE